MLYIHDQQSRAHWIRVCFNFGKHIGAKRLLTIESVFFMPAYLVLGIIGLKDVVPTEARHSLCLSFWAFFLCRGCYFCDILSTYTIMFIPPQLNMSGETWIFFKGAPWFLLGLFPIMAGGKKLLGQETQIYSFFWWDYSSGFFLWSGRSNGEWEVCAYFSGPVVRRPGFSVLPWSVRSWLIFEPARWPRFLFHWFFSLIWRERCVVRLQRPVWRRTSLDSHGLRVKDHCFLHPHGLLVLTQMRDQERYCFWIEDFLPLLTLHP